MQTNIEKYKSDLQALVKLGDTMSFGLLLGPGPPEKHVKGGTRSAAEKAIDEDVKEARGSFEREYQRWYSEAGALIRQLLPDRWLEFEQLYKGDGKRKAIDILTYTIQDWLNDLRREIYLRRRDFSMILLSFLRSSTHS